jgi:hypothetical protein
VTRKRRHDLDVLVAMATEHVTYEVTRLMLWTFISVPPESINAPTPQHAVGLSNILRQATLESSLVHLRNVAEFLVSPRSTARPTDLIADDYFDEASTGRPGHVFGTSDAEHRTTMTEIHRRVAHLSVQRVGLAPFDWTSVLEQVPTIVVHFSAFLRDLRDAHPERVHWFGEITRQVRALNLDP